MADQLDVLVLCTHTREFWALDPILETEDRRVTPDFKLLLGNGAGRRWGLAKIKHVTADRTCQVIDALVHVHLPKVLVAAYYAVSLVEDVEPCWMVVADRILRHTTQKLYEAPLPPPAETQAERVAPVLSVPQWPARPATRRKLHERTGAVVAAEDCYTFFKGVAAVRLDAAFFFVATGLDQPLGQADAAFLGPNLPFQIGALIGALAGPGVVEELARAHKVAQELAEKFITRLRQEAEALLARAERAAVDSG